MAHPETAPLLGARAANGRHGTGEPGVEHAPPPRSPIRPDMINRHSKSNYNGHAAARHEHEEKHTDYSDIIRDVIIGFADGLTVPFALTAGLSSLGSTRIVVIGGLAELFSGMISMGLGAYLAAVTDRQHWEAEYARESWEVDHCPDVEREEIFEILERYGLSRNACAPIVDELCVATPKGKKSWVQFMMDFELQLPEPDVSRAWISALTMGLSYFIGGLVPMIPYFAMAKVREALFVSIAVTAVILMVFGYVKSWVTIRNKKAGFMGALQTLFIGALAAGTSYAIVRLLDSGDGST